MAKIPLLLFFSFLLAVSSGAETSSDLVAAESVASDYKAQSVGSSGKYGYPYMIAPTLGPKIQARSDNDDDESLQSKSYGTRTSIDKDDDIVVKKTSLKKSKFPYTYTTIRRQDEDTPVEKPFRSYKEPKYRNFDELEDSFQPRRIDLNYPYSQYDYSKFVPKPSHSPRDPFLSPSDEPVDSFYPSAPKVKSYPSSSVYGTRNQRGPTYGAGNYDDSIQYHGGSYGEPSSGYTSSGGPSSGYTSSGGLSSGYTSSGGSSPSYPSSGGSYSYQDYEIKSNEPIMGNIRKRLLTYAGASDLYEGEPDYLQEISRNKYKYGNIGNDYYAYGGPGYKDSYRDFPYVESKISLIRKSRRV